MSSFLEFKLENGHLIQSLTTVIKKIILKNYNMYNQINIKSLKIILYGNQMVLNKINQNYSTYKKKINRYCP